MDRTGDSLTVKCLYFKGPDGNLAPQKVWRWQTADSRNTMGYLEQMCMCVHVCIICKWRASKSESDFAEGVREFSRIIRITYDTLIRTILVSFPWRFVFVQPSPYSKSKARSEKRRMKVIDLLFFCLQAASCCLSAPNHPLSNSCSRVERNFFVKQEENGVEKWQSMNF